MNVWRILAAFALLIPVAAAGTPQLSLNAGNGQACPTGSGQYTIALHNPGPAEDRYTVNVDAPWTDAATLSRSTVTVPSGATERVFLWVQAPRTASPGDHSFSVSATSSNNGKTVTDTGTLTVLSCRAVGLDPAQQRQEVCRGDQATYTLDVENRGQVEETYRLSADAGQLSTSRVTLGPGEERSVTLSISSTEAVNRTISVRAESTTSYASDSTELRFLADTCRGVDVSVAPAETSVCRSDTILLTAAVSNTGRVDDTYRVTIGDRTQNISVAAGQTVTVEQTIHASDVDGGIQTAAVSTKLGAVQDSAVSDITVARCHDLSLDPVTTAPDAGNRTLVEFALTNNGTQPTTYTVQLDGPDWMDVEPENLSLAAGATAPVYVYMAPDFFGDGRYTATIVVDGEGTRKAVQMNATARNGTVTVSMAGTRTPTGQVAGQPSGLIAVLVTALILLIGGYWFFRRRGNGDGRAAMLRDRDRTADDVLNQNANTVVKTLRDDEFSQDFLKILRKEEQQGKNRQTVLNEIRNQLDED